MDTCPILIPRYVSFLGETCLCHEVTHGLAQCAFNHIH